MTDQLKETATPVQARQGVRGRPVFYVLMGSLALLALYMVGMLTWSDMSYPTDPADRSQQASRAEVTGSINGQSEKPSSANSAHVPGGNPAYPEPAVTKADPGAAK